MILSVFFPQEQVDIWKCIGFFYSCSKSHHTTAQINEECHNYVKNDTSGMLA